jgi:hypothetical protein
MVLNSTFKNISFISWRAVLSGLHIVSSLQLCPLHLPRRTLKKQKIRRQIKIGSYHYVRYSKQAFKLQKCTSVLKQKKAQPRVRLLLDPIFICLRIFCFFKVLLGRCRGHNCSDDTICKPLPYGFNNPYECVTSDLTFTPTASSNQVQQSMLHNNLGVAVSLNNQ